MGHVPGNAVTAHLETSDPKLLNDAWCAVEAAVSFKHLPDLGREGSVLQDPSARVVCRRRQA